MKRVSLLITVAYNLAAYIVDHGEVDPVRLQDYAVRLQRACGGACDAMLEGANDKSRAIVTATEK